MIIKLDPTKKFAIFQDEGGKEYLFLKKFPAFITSHYLPTTHIVAKPQVLFNVYHRLKRFYKHTLKVTQDVLDLLRIPFKLKELPSEFQYCTKPFDFQEIALRYLYTVGSGGILLDPGMGKSKVALDYIALMKFERSLIICPKPLLFVWEDEIQTHRPDKSFYVVKTTDWEKEKAGIAEAAITIINYDKAVALLSGLSKSAFKFIYLDEFLIKNASTERTKALTKLRQVIPYAAGGSGTLVNNSVDDVFAPVRFLEPSLVGMSHANFLDHFAIKKKTKEGQYDRVVAFRYQDEARSILESCCIVMTKEKWLKLPPKEFFDILVPMTEEQRRVSSELSRNKLCYMDGVELEVDSALVLLSKLYQISNGFIYYNEKKAEEKESIEDLLAPPVTTTKKIKGARKTLRFKENPKVAALDKLLYGKLAGRRLILWFNMQAEYEAIKCLLDSHQSNYFVIKGGETKTGDKVRRFNNDPNITYLVCQAKSVNYGITVLGTTLDKLEASDTEVLPGVSPEVYTEVFFSLSFSLEVYLQQQDRIHRLGQTKDCEYYRIFTTSLVEKKIRDAISEKIGIRRSMLVDIAEKIQKEQSEMV